MVELITDEASIATSPNVTVTSEVAEATHSDSTTKIVDISPNNFVISSGDLYSGEHKGISTWLADAITAEIASGALSLTNLVRDLDTALNEVNVGIQQSLSSLQTDIESNSTNLTTQVSRIDGNVAYNLELTQTKVDADGAEAATISYLATEFTNPESVTNAWFTSANYVTSTATEANATSINGLTSSFNSLSGDVAVNASVTDTFFTHAGYDPVTGEYGSAGYFGLLEASIGDVDVRLVTEEAVSIGTHIWNEVETLTIGMKRIVDGLQETYFGTVIGWKQTTADTAQSWAGGASSILQDPDTGAATGWSYADGSGIDQSIFKIQADKFQVSNSDNSKTPFIIDSGTGKITMTSDVEIDGNLNIKNGSVTATQIDVTDLFAQDITATGSITGAEIIGATIRNADSSFSVSADGDIVGGTITGSTIDINKVVMTTDAGYSTKPVILATLDVSTGTAALYPYNSTHEFAPGKMARTDGQLAEGFSLRFQGMTSKLIDQGGGNYASVDYNGWVIVNHVSSADDLSYIDVTIHDHAPLPAQVDNVLVHKGLLLLLKKTPTSLGVYWYTLFLQPRTLYLTGDFIGDNKFSLSPVNQVFYLTCYNLQ